MAWVISLPNDFVVYWRRGAFSWIKGNVQNIPHKEEDNREDDRGYSKGYNHFTGPLLWITKPFIGLMNTTPSNQHQEDSNCDANNKISQAFDHPNEWLFNRNQKDNKRNQQSHQQISIKWNVLRKSTISYLNHPWSLRQSLSYLKGHCQHRWSE